MAHLSGNDIKNKLEDAKKHVKVGAKYYHYKSPNQFYTLVDLCIIEATEGIGVLYKPEYEGFEGIIWMRPIEDFLARVEWNGTVVSRFTEVQ